MGNRKKPKLNIKDPAVLEALSNALDEIKSWDIQNDRRGINMKECNILCAKLNGEYSSRYLCLVLKGYYIREAIIRFKLSRSDASTSGTSEAVPSKTKSHPDTTDDEPLPNDITPAFSNRDEAEIFDRDLKAENEKLKRKCCHIQEQLDEALAKNKRLKLEVRAMSEKQTEF